MPPVRPGDKVVLTLNVRLDTQHTARKCHSFPRPCLLRFSASTPFLLQGGCLESGEELFRIDPSKAEHRFPVLVPTDANDLLASFERPDPENDVLHPPEGWQFLVLLMVALEITAKKLMPVFWA